MAEGEWDRAAAEVDRLQRELDITNADHIALWLEANMHDSPLGWLACRIVEAHERATSTRCDNCYGDPRGDCIRAGRCIFGIKGKHA